MQHTFSCGNAEKSMDLLQATRVEKMLEQRNNTFFQLKNLFNVL